LTQLTPIENTKPWYGPLEAAQVAEALKGKTSGDGPYARSAERRLQDMLGVRRVLLTTSCTHALELGLLALGIGRGDEVVCPSFTFVSTANAVLRVGATPVLADIEETTLGLDVADLERRLTPRTAAVIPVHYAGVAPDMDAILDLAGRRRVKVVEDAAQGLAASYKGRPLGTLGDAAAFSFHETKNLSCGEGGALAVSDPEVAARAEIIREKGTNRSAFLRGEVDKYTWVAEGSSYVVSDVLGALLDAQLQRLDEIQAGRARVVAAYEAGLAGWAREHGVRLFEVPPGRVANHHIFWLLFETHEERDRAMDALRAERIQATFHYVPLHTSPMAHTLVAAAGPLPVAESVAGRLLRLPLHPQLTDVDVQRVIGAVTALR
jgi:dTDP-4-amino-4,6-dideoxygalactose transaminase